jgi:transposase
MCALLVGLPDVVVAGVGEWPSWLRIVIATALLGSPTCCGVAAHRHGVREVELVDLPVFGRPARLVWRKQRWRCPRCRRAWTEQDPQIASARWAMTTRAARWATLQVGRHGRSVAEVASDLQCDWHTVMHAVALYGTPLIDDPDRFGAVCAVGLDETLFARVGPFRRQLWSTQIVDVAAGQLLDIVPGRDSTAPCAWFAARSEAWRAGIGWATLDLSASYRTVFDTMLPDAVQVADPFHVVRVANTALDECRRRVQNETIGHRGRKPDPL